MTNMTTILLLISGGLLVIGGMIIGTMIMRYGIGIGNKITLNSINETPFDEEIISTEQEITE